MDPRIKQPHYSTKCAQTSVLFVAEERANGETLVLAEEEGGGVATSTGR